jgi:dynein heavy chain
VGTGKTETTKELAKCLGRICFVFTCSQSLNHESLIKFFKGFASGGSWACFDELNRIDADVLSILSTTVLTVNQAQRERKQEILFADDEKAVKFNPSCAIFFT